MALFYPGLNQAANTNGGSIAGAKWKFYLSGTTTPTAVYSNSTLATSLGATVTADASGWFVPIYFDENLALRARLETSAGALIGGNDIDPVNPAASSSGTFVTPEQFGAVGNGTTDDAPYFELARAYCLTNGIREIRLSKDTYRLNAKLRTTSPNASPWISEGHPLVIPYNQQIRFVGTGANPSRLKFYSYGGATFNGTTPGTNFQAVAGYCFRGHGILVQTSNTDPGEGSRSSIYLERVILDGGTTYSGSVTQPASVTTGNGWDYTHKGIAVEPDKTYGGHVEMVDCEMVGWRGETLYASNNGSRTKLSRFKFSDANGSGLNINPGGQIDIDGGVVRNCGVAFEGWTGDVGGRITDVTFIDCTGTSTIQGGKAGASTWTATRLASDELPIGTIGLTFINCAVVSVGSWLQGKITSIDTPISIGPTSVFSVSGAKNTSLDILCITDTLNDTAKVTVSGSASAASKLLDDLDLRIRYQRTPEAIAATRAPGDALVYGGSLGSNISVQIEGMIHCTRPPRATTTVTDFAPMFRGEIWSTADFANNLQDVQTTPTIALTGPMMAFYTTNNAVYSCIMPSSNVQKGRKARLFNGNGAGGGVIKFSAVFGTSKVRAGGDIYLLPGNWLDMEFNGTYWEPTGKANYADVITIPVGDETTAITTGTSKVTFRAPNYPVTLVGVRGSLSTAQATGTIFTVDVNEAGTSVISTKLTIDNTEKTTTTAATPLVISDTAIAADAEMTIDVDQIGDGTAKGLKVYLEVIPT